MWSFISRNRNVNIRTMAGNYKYEVECQASVCLDDAFIQLDSYDKEMFIKENPALRVYLIEGFIAGYHGAVCTASSWFSVDECLPERDAECIVLDKDGRISFGHIVDKKIAVDYDGWNIPNVVFWTKFEPTKDMIEFYEKEERI